MARVARNNNKLIFLLVLILIVLFTIGFFTRQQILKEPKFELESNVKRNPYSIIKNKPPHQTPPPIATRLPSNLETVKQFNKKTDEEWRNILAKAPIIAIEEFERGLSLKFTVALEYKGKFYKALMKPAIDPGHVVNGTTWDYYDYYSVKKPKVTRTGRSKGQGSAEILGYYLDRTLSLYRKPPMSGRFVSNQVFFTYNNDNETIIHREMEEFFLPVAMIAWVEGIQFVQPRETQGYGLKQHSAPPTEPEQLTYQRTVSDAIVLDFLIDDHDRKRLNGNWAVLKNKPEEMLIWDSGIAWNHPPEGKTDGSCSQILCGPDNFIPIPLYHLKDQNVNLTEKCQPICRFSGDFIDRLSSNSDRIKTSWAKNLAQDPIDNLWDFLLFYTHKSDKESIRHLIPQNIYQGFENQIKKLMQHIDNCIEIYGEENVKI